MPSNGWGSIALQNEVPDLSSLLFYGSCRNPTVEVVRKNDFPLTGAWPTKGPPQRLRSIASHPVNGTDAVCPSPAPSVSVCTLKHTGGFKKRSNCVFQRRENNNETTAQLLRAPQPPSIHKPPSPNPATYRPHHSPPHPASDRNHPSDHPCTPSRHCKKSPQSRRTACLRHRCRGHRTRGRSRGRAGP